MGGTLGPEFDHIVLVALLIVLWTLPWKAWALWLAARRNERWWFLALLVLNTLAILELVYIFFVAKQSEEKKVTGVTDTEESSEAQDQDDSQN